MRLIDADELIKAIEQSRNNNPHKDCRIKRIHDIEHGHFIKMVSEQRTAFNKEKAIEELKEMATHSASCKNQCEFGSTEYFDYMGAEVAYKTTIEIVQKGGIE